ncbi:MAG: TolC family protein [Bacteroidia bacterium]
MTRSSVILLGLLFAFQFADSQNDELSSYVRTGLQNSPLLKDYANQVQSGSLDSALIRAQRKPQVNALGQLLIAPAYNGWGYDEAVTNTGNYMGVISASQSLFTKKILAPQYESVNISNQSITNTSRISAHDLEKSITDQYLAAYASLKTLAYNETVYKLLKDEEKLLASFVQQGIYRQTDYLSFSIAMKSQEIQIRQSKIEYRNNLRVLNLLCGIGDTAYVTLKDPVLKPVIHEKNNSPFFAQLRIDSLKIINQKSIIRSNYRPHLNWFADAGFLGSNPSLLYRNFGTSFGLNFSMPLYDGKQRNIQYQKLSIGESTRTAYKQFFEKQYDQHIILINMQLKENDALTAEIREQIAASESLIEMSRQLMNKGDLPVTDFILNIKNYLDIESQLNQAQLTQMQLINEFNYWSW